MCCDFYGCFYQKNVITRFYRYCYAIISWFYLGPEVLGGFLAGATASGVLLGMFQNNAGGAWDNAKKSFEKRS